MEETICAWPGGPGARNTVQEMLLTSISSRKCNRVVRCIILMSTLRTHNHAASVENAAEKLLVWAVGQTRTVAGQSSLL